MDKKKILTAIAALGLAFAAGYWASPVKVVEKVKIVEKTDVKRHVDTDTRIVERPDGSKETVIKEKDRSTEHSDRTSEGEKTTVASRDESAWLFTTLMGVKRKDLDLTLDSSAVTVLIQRRIILGIYAGGYVTMDGDFGLGMTLKF